MPNKKKKNQGRNAFYYFMVSIRPQLERQGVILENGMQSLAEIAGPRWKDLPDHEKEVYQEMARQEKGNRKFQPARYDRMDCTGQLISKRVDTVSLNERRRNQEREQVKRGWLPGEAVCDEKFYLIGFMSMCELDNHERLPCELGVVEYSLNGGIHRFMHRFINPGQIPKGFTYEAMSTSKKTHQIPTTGLADMEDSYRKIWLDLLRFVNPEGQAVCPPLYSRISETKLTEVCLNWLARCAEMPNKLKKVFELEGLICDLHAHNSETPRAQLSKPQITELLSTTAFDYEAGVRCKWHEDNEVVFCALGTAKRYCYCISDLLCPVYDIQLTPDHLPERPEVSCCTVVQPAPYRGGRQQQQQRQQRQQRGAGGSRGAASLQESGVHGAKSYPYDEGSSGPYMRRGPTYDERAEVPELQSLPPRNAAWRSAQPQVPPLARAQVQAPPGGPAVGRGRGRGRAAAPSQPLRRPNIPRMAAYGGAATLPSPANEAGWAASVPVNGESDRPAPANVPTWAQVSSCRGPAFGRGVPAAARPQVYAGQAVPPSPSEAPTPPLAWQQHVPGPRPGQVAWQGPAGESGLGAQLGSMSLGARSQYTS